ncbi:hypothetical protein UFOVP1229_84 [uncultured Caudovirales phage]|uniref:Uncharacterized protein n=1 Tax=uncultured Caudovirales phage TaxID=2100421 RepID=A0A6J5RBD3_9CAUD|nr:hypothetical protein UFOVP1229_84 [uncultured Caudovirales phage]
MTSVPERLTARTRVSVKCDCGEVRDVYPHALASGQCTSCGCVRRELSDAAYAKRCEKMMGLRVGYRVVLQVIRRKSRKDTPKCRVRCDCGNESDVADGSLLQGKALSCGCMRKPLFRKAREKSRKDWSFLIGERFGRLVVTAIHANKPATVIADCDCGNRVERSAAEISRDRRRNKSCGCFIRERAKTLAVTTHGVSGTPEYNSFTCMKHRCLNPEYVDYHRYGQRRITICEGLMDVHGFIAVLGSRPDGTTLDRIDNNLGYWCGSCSECIEEIRPKNVRWTDLITQGNNQRSNRLITARGETHTLAEWVRISGTPRSAIYHRLQKGMNPEEAIFSPVLDYSNRKFRRKNATTSPPGNAT